MSSTSAPGRYVPDIQIGRGGMATVWRAHDTVLDRWVALKRLRPALLDDEEIAARFRREAEAVARLSHPGIVRMLDRGEDAEGPYLVMELVEGQDLKARIQRYGALPPDDARAICAQVARALQYAHEQGIVHRDIKSQNVLIDDLGIAKLTDFGIARLAEGHGDQGLTRTGMMVGSSDYLAPEQAEGRPVDGRTDVYALGIVLWECLTGRLPFPADSFVSVAMRHVTDPLPDPRSVSGGIPAQLAAAAMRASAKRPEQRFQSAGSFAQALVEPGGGDTAAIAPVDDPWHREEPEGATGRVRRPRRSRRPLALLASVVAAVVLVAGAVLAIQALQGPNGGSDPTLRQTALQFIPRDYDPDGGDGEQPTLVPLVADGQLDTAWLTERYKGSAAFGGYPKRGVGLTLETGADSRPTQIAITGTPGVPVEIRAEGDLDGPPLAVATLNGEEQRIDLPADAPSRLVVWITRLVATAENPDMYQAGINEIQLFGVSRSSPS